MSKRKLGPLANEETQRQLRERDKDRKRQWGDDLRHILSTPDGRRFFYVLVFDRCKALDVTLAGGDELTFRHEGQRSIGIELLRDAERLCPDLYAHAVTERAAERALEAHARKAAHKAVTDDGEEQSDADG